MKPNILITTLVLVCITAIKLCGDAVTKGAVVSKDNYWSFGGPVYIAKEHYGQRSPAFYYQHPDLFDRISEVKNRINNKETYWIKKRIRLDNVKPDAVYTLSFSYLTHVEVVLFDASGKKVNHRKAGLFCHLNDLYANDGRDHFNMDLVSGKEYTILLRVKHIKGYLPLYDFRLQPQLQYIQGSQQNALTNAVIEGAIVALLLDIALAWLVSKYRPYIWIFCFLLTIGIYSFALQNQYIDRIFPNRPQLGWSSVSLFSRLGAMSFYLLTIDFLNLRKLDRGYYKLALCVIGSILLATVFIFINNYYFANYNYSNWINIALGIIHILFFSNLFISIWNKIDQLQRFLAYGSIFFTTGIGAMLFYGLTLQERAIDHVSMLTQLFALCITMLLLIGIRLRLRKSELEHNKWIEFVVHERTIELRNANHELYHNQVQLLQKNKYIETLIDEVNHRVKNNLQLLYSLSSMHKTAEDQQIDHRNVGQTMQDRIHAIMLVNQLLIYNQNSQLRLDILVIETVDYLRQMYDPEDRVIIELDIMQDWLISTNTSIPLALIITEFLTNSYKYAFSHTPIARPKISLCIDKRGTKSYMKFTDNGIGIENLNDKASFGIKLIKDLTRQIKGTVVIQHLSGFIYLFEFNTEI
ncbi:sensor histidine kinase [Sphingobacterium sp.]|uniref:sensor histidine kinase n=1 Tax=Sphingobacterium sp. TaxID=341027 RepID=UPI002FDD6F77